MNKKMFALDIGTRKVMGLWVEADSGRIRVLDTEVLEHPTRAMSTGQIQDAAKVTQVVRQVTRAVEERCGIAIHRAAVAVAGRNLRTLTGKAALNCPQDRPLDRADAERLTFCALEDALHRLELEAGTDRDGGTPYYCVGYVVSRFILDGDAVSHPAGHRGARLEVEVLATFLPRPVLESQLAVLEAAGLEAESVTLEPIAALQAVVDSEFRNLDLALVDVGAGTSDVALVQGGAIRAFGMVPCAGDGITERLCNEFLLDFPSAEKIKRAALGGGILETANIFRRPLYLESSRILAAMAPAVSDLARKIARCIVELGGQSPRAVLCVGGGSLTPGLLEELAGALGLPSHCVGMRSPGGPEGMKDASGRALGPEAATPLGIACVAASEGGVRFRQVHLNGRRLFLLEMDRPLTVLSALMASGISAKDIFGWPGPSKTYTVNGEFRIFKARPPCPARISILGAEVGVDHPILPGDRIEFVAAAAGEDAGGTVGEAVGMEPPAATADDAPRGTVRIFCNGRRLDPSEPLEDRMNLIVSETEPSAVSENLAPDAPGDPIRSETVSPGTVGSAVAPAAPTGAKAMTVRVNGQWTTLKDPEGREMTIGRDAPPILVDALRGVSIGPSLAQAGKRLKLLLDGQEARFTSPLHDGADVRVFFE